MGELSGQGAQKPIILPLPHSGKWDTQECKLPCSPRPVRLLCPPGLWWAREWGRYSVSDGREVWLLVNSQEPGAWAVVEDQGTGADVSCHEQASVQRECKPEQLSKCGDRWGLV